jgi:hypothetical protein
MVDERGGQALIDRLDAELREHRSRYGRSSSEGLRLFNALVAAYAACGRRIDELERYEPDEARRFFSRTIQGPDGHVYWSGDLKRFLLNDGSGRRPALWWWQHLYGSHPGKLRADCGEEACINPRHAVVILPGAPRIYPDHVIIGALQVWALQHGHSPSSRQWDGRPSHIVVKLRFGSWENALRAAGLAPANPNRPRTRADCLEALRWLKGRIGHWPSYDDYRNARAQLHEQGFVASPTTIMHHLGGWRSAIRAAKRR